MRALYDYQGEGDDELSFCEGQVIKLLSRDENGKQPCTCFLFEPYLFCLTLICHSACISYFICAFSMQAQ